MKFYVCATPYHLFITLCRIFAYKEESYIYLSTHDHNVFKIFNAYRENILKITYVKDVYLRKRGNIKERLFLEDIVDKIEYRSLKNKINKSHVIIFPWNLYSLFSPAEYIFKYATRVTLIEEGANLYAMKKPSNKFLFIKKYIYGRNLEFYKSDKIDKILVQFPKRYPNYLQRKIEKFDINNIINLLEEKEKKEIASILSNDIDIDKINNESIIILTQPLSEDGFISIDEKKEIYKEIIFKYKSEYDIILKKHPRETTKYDYNIDNLIELNGDFPSEVFKLLDVKFKKAIGICTSAVKFIDAEERINIDEDFIKKLENK